MKLKDYVYIDAYKQKNLGDDLFLHIMFKKYPETRFLLFGDAEYKGILKKYRHVKVVTEKSLNLRKKFVRKYRTHKENPFGAMIQGCNSAVYIGGSIFQEPKIPMKMDWFLNEHSFVIGANFGPCETKFYYERIEALLKEMEGVCFRDKYSYEKFSSLGHIKYAADVLFCVNHYYQIKPKETSEKRLFISLMDFSVSHPELEEYMPAYYDFMQKRVAEALKGNIEVVLSSFCEPEGDENAVNHILESLSAEDRKKVQVVNYNGFNEAEVLQNIANSDVVIGTRFHSMIFGLLYGKKVIPVCYSKKHQEVLNDMGIKADDVITVKNLKEQSGRLTVCRLTKEQKEELEKSAEEQFFAFDSWRERKLEKSL